MSFFNRLTNAGKDMAKKTKELADITKLNLQISSEEDNIKNKYIEIGKLYYELFSSNPDEKFAELCSSITESMNKISALKEQILEIKGVKKCPKCGAEIAFSAVFCSACGTKIENDNDTTVENDTTAGNTEDNENNGKTDENTENTQSDVKVESTEAVETNDENADASIDEDSSSSQ